MLSTFPPSPDLCSLINQQPPRSTLPLHPLRSPHRHSPTWAIYHRQKHLSAKDHYTLSATGDESRNRDHSHSSTHLSSQSRISAAHQNACSTQRPIQTRSYRRWCLTSTPPNA